MLNSSICIPALVALKLLVVFIDPTIRVYLGDSAAYLFGALDSGRLPDDRSFTYSLLIRALVRPFEALRALLWWQSLAGVLTAYVMWHVLVARFHVASSIALAGACLLALEPAQLYYERMVLAESFGLLAFVLFFAAAAAYLASGRMWWLPAVALAGLAAATLRLNYLPVVLVISVAVPWLRLFAAPRPAWMPIARHAVVAILVAVTLHVAFQQWVAWIFKSPPGYIARAGFMQLGLVLPLVQPQHLTRVGLPPDFAAGLRFPLDDPDARMPHMWAAGGFIRALREQQLPIEPIARPLVRMALADDPFGIVRLGLHTVGNYFRAEPVRHALDNDLGRRVIPEEILWSLREIWHYDANGLWTRTTAVSWYFERSTWLLVLCLFALVPLALAAAWVCRSRPDRTQALLLLLCAFGLVSAHVLFVPVAFYRYLHPLPCFVIMAGCVVVSATASERRATADN